MKMAILGTFALKMREEEEEEEEAYIESTVGELPL